MCVWVQMETTQDGSQSKSKEAGEWDSKLM